MGTEYSPCAGIGIDFDIDTLRKFGAKDLADTLQARLDDEDDEFYEWEYLDEISVDSPAINYGESGFAAIGNTKFYLFAADPIFGVDRFISSLHTIGLVDIKKEDLKFICEIYAG